MVLGPYYEAQTCEVIKCKQNGNWGEWEAWSKCNPDCRDGKKSRKRLCNNPAPDFGGAPCENSPLGDTEEKVCFELKPCAMDGKFGAW